MNGKEFFVSSLAMNCHLLQRGTLGKSGILFPLLFGVIIFIASTSPLFAEETQPRDILEFLGALTEKQVETVAVNENSFLIPLKRKIDATVDPQSKCYFVLLKEISSQEKEVLSDAADGHWDHFDLLRASLIIEGVCDSEKIKKYEERLDRIADKIKEQAKNNPKVEGNKEELTRLIFENLHTELLTGEYNIENTNPADSFETGNYNCVSATVLFNSLAKRVGLDVCGLEMSGHVLSRAKYGTRVADLETTCPGWFSQKNNREVQKVAKPEIDNTEYRTNELVQISRKTREITDVQLVAAIYYNQGYDHWQANRLPESTVATAKALLLDPENENAWGNLVGAVNNIALGFSMEQKRHDIAAGLLDQIELMDPGFKDLKSNQFHVYSPWIKELVAAEQIADAKSVYNYAAQRLPNEPRMKQLEKLIQ